MKFKNTMFGKFLPICVNCKKHLDFCDRFGAQIFIRLIDLNQTKSNICFDDL